MQYCDGADWIAFPKPALEQDDVIVTGYQHTCGIRKVDGSAWCWGRGSLGRLGYGGTEDQHEPVQVNEPGPWKTLGASGVWNNYATCGIKEDGTAWCWGSGERGMLGYGGTADQHEPVQVNEPGPWIAVEVGLRHSCGIKEDGTAWCWGQGANGALGYGGTSDQHTPRQVSNPGPWSAITTGGTHSCAIKAGDGTAWCWGPGGSGRLGYGGTDQQNNPVQVSDPGPWIAISAGHFHTCGIKTDGTAWCWGLGENGRLGDGNSGSGYEQLNPVQVVDEAGTGTWDDWIAIDSTYRSTCGIREDGTAWCWGYGADGNLGYGGTTSTQNRPRQVSGAGPWSTITAGGRHSCGIKTDGSFWCWGLGSSGRLGYGGEEQQNNPVQVSDAGPWGEEPGCTDPVGEAGMMLYDEGDNVLIYCNGAVWVAAGPKPGAGGAGCSNPPGEAGVLLFDSTDKVLVYCDGSVWRGIGK